MLFLVNFSRDHIPYALSRMAQQHHWPSCSDCFGFLVQCNRRTVAGLQ